MTENNQRVKNAVLSLKLDHLIKGQKEIKADLRLNTEARITSEERWKAHDKEHANLRVKSWAGDISAAVVGGFAALVAWASR